VIAEMHSVLGKYAPGLAPDVMTASGWTSAKVFELAAKQLPETPNSDAILHGLWSIKDNDLGGITSPLTYVEGQPSKRLGCFWTPTVKGGRWTGGDTRIWLK
jgi:branched-chain amino acid transport system substrate-binding protein